MGSAQALILITALAVWVSVCLAAAQPVMKAIRKHPAATVHAMTDDTAEIYAMLGR